MLLRHVLPGDGSDSWGSHQGRVPFLGAELCLGSGNQQPEAVRGYGMDRGLGTEFGQFWNSYPRREAKLAALQAYEKARRLATADEILAGVERYKARMPEERQYRPLPATFLNQGRWMDEDEPEIVAPTRKYWADECAELHGGTCDKQWTHEMRKRDVAV